MSAAVPAMPTLMPRPADAGLYERLSPSERYIHETRDEALLALLRRHGIQTLGGLRMIELGCGEGSFLRSLLYYGAQPELLCGIDLDPARIESAAALAPGTRLFAGDGAALPYKDGAFDLAFAFTFFSSVVDPAPRRRAASETLRVLRTGGLLVVYDFWINPLNTRVRALGAGELRSIFRGDRIEIQRVTLAPPIVRALGGRSICRTLERLPFLRTHLLAAVTKESQ